MSVGSPLSRSQTGVASCRQFAGRSQPPMAASLACPPFAALRRNSPAVDYVDATLVRLAEPASRGTVFDELALEQILSAAYDTGALPLQGPFSAVFDEFTIGFHIPALGQIEGLWQRVGIPEPTEARFRLRGLRDQQDVRVDAIWRGSIVARISPDEARISAVDVAWPSLAGIDDDVESDLGALPADATALEQERRGRVLERIRATLDEPAAFTETMLDAWLREIGATSTGDLLSRFASVVHPGTARVTFSPPNGAAPSPHPMPIAAALLIRGADSSIADLISDSKLVRDRLEPLGLERPQERHLPLRRSLVVIWVLPAAVFDDVDWPGGTDAMSAEERRDARRVAAGQWLAREGIGLVTT
jgi:hypothetical protein